MARQGCSFSAGSPKALLCPQAEPDFFHSAIPPFGRHLDIGRVTEDAFYIDTDILTQPSPDWREPLAILDLDKAGDVGSDTLRLPPCPVIGIGDASHPLAAYMDVLLEPPVTLSALRKSILSNPLTSSVLVTLLRDLEGLPTERALTRESLVYGLLQGSDEHRHWLKKPRSEPALHTCTLQLSRHGKQLDIMLDRPEALNVIDRPMRDALYAAFEIAALDSEIERVNLTARGKAFSIGAELGEFGTTRDPALAHLIRLQTLPAHQLAKIGHKLEVEVNGACVGAGLEMAAFAGHFVASEAAWFQLPELEMGLIPGAGGCVSMLNRIGRQRTALMVLSGRRISAKIALEWGLVDTVMDD